MKKVFTMVTLFIAVGLVSTNTTIAGTTAHEGHGQTHDEATMEKKGSPNTFKHAAVTNQIKAEFQIMSLASMNMKDPDGATHHIMVNLSNDSTKQAIKDAVGKVKVIGPDKKEQLGTLKNYNGVFAANFTFKQKGKYGVICLAKIAGEKHAFKFWYPHD